MKLIGALLLLSGLAAGLATPVREPAHDLVAAPTSPAPDSPGGSSVGPAGEPTPQPASDPPFEPRTVSIVMGGDLLWHDTVWISAAEDGARVGRRFDFDPMFAAVRPMIETADVAVCHEEVPFAAPGAPYRSYPLFAAPPAIAPWIADMGFDACTTASNHSLDQGYDGLVRTADLLEAQGVPHVGTFRTLSERRRPVLVETDQGVRVGIVAGTYGTNGLPLPEGREWSVSMWDAPNLLTQARRARRQGADIVVVHLHGGDEYSSVPNADQVALVRRLTRSPAVDLVLGEHAHVVQPITRVNGTWVVYGMGNLVAQQESFRPDTYRGILVRFGFVERRDGGFEVRRAAHLPVAWGRYTPGDPIRVRRAVGVDRAAILAAVRGRGRAPGLLKAL